MIVRNEAAIIERCLAQLMEHQKSFAEFSVKFLGRFTIDPGLTLVQIALN
jgi:hypothetical protein